MADRLLWLCVSDDLSMYLSSVSADTSARRVGQVLFKDLLEQDEAFTVFVELRFQLPQLCMLRNPVFLWRGVNLSVVPRRPGIFPCCRGSTARSSILRLVGSFYRPVDVIAFPCRVVAISLGVGVRLGGVETSSSLLQQPLPE